MALPNLIIAGAPKCGTSSLFRYIADHPSAEGATVKETCYFADPASHIFDPKRNFALDGLAGYEAFFPVARPDAAVRLEATPAYLYQATALAELPDIPSAPRFLFLLREPSRQILSTYRYFSNNWMHLDGDIGFSDFVEMARRRDARLAGNELLQDALANARYVDWLTRWRDRVGPARCKVLLLEDLQADPAAFMGGLAAWLGLDPAFYRGYAFPRENETYRVRSRALQRANVALRGLVARTPVYTAVRAAYRRLNTAAAPAPLNPEDKAALDALRESYMADNARLADAFGLDLAPWREAPP